MSDILEAAARALLAVQEDWTLERAAKWLAYYDEEMANYTKEATAVLAAVTPLIEANALERAAKVAEDYDVKRIDGYIARDNVATAIATVIRALKEQP